MDIEELRKLIRLMDEAGLSELEIEDRSGKVRLVRGRRARSTSDDAEDRDHRSREDAFASGESHDHGRAAQPAPGTSAITSPMVGTFYRSPAPDASPFVNVGDIVHVGQVVCIIEAMKMMNEIHAEVAGRILSTVAENGASVEYGSPLFMLELLD